MSDSLYNDEAIIRGVSYSARNGHRVTLEVDPSGWEALKAAGTTTRCAMVLVEIQENGTPIKPIITNKDATRAAILCNDHSFQDWIGAIDADEAAQKLRAHCDVLSRSELRPENRAWVDLLDRYNRRLPLRTIA